jgi:hypothetical protein
VHVVAGFCSYSLITWLIFIAILEEFMTCIYTNGRVKKDMKA